MKYCKDCVNMKKTDNQWSCVLTISTHLELDKEGSYNRVPNNDCQKFKLKKTKAKK